MVSGRKPAALGLRALLAQGRRADLEERRADREDRQPAQGRDRRTPTDDGRHREAARSRCRLCVCRPTKTPCIGCRRKQRCRSMSIPTIQSWPIPKSARAWRGYSTTGLNKPKWIRAADPARGRRCRFGLDERTLEAAARPSVPDTGRFAARAAAADVVAAACPARRISLHRRAGSDGAAARTRGRRQGRAADGVPPKPAQKPKPKPKPVRTAIVGRNCATAYCASSCRRSRSSKTISN